MAQDTPPASRHGSETPAVAAPPSVSGSPLLAPSDLAGDRARDGVVLCDTRGIDGALLRRATTLAIEPIASFLSLRRTESRTVGGVTDRLSDNARRHPNEGAIALLKEWLAADWEEDTGELDALKRDLDENRSSDRKLFP